MELTRRSLFSLFAAAPLARHLPVIAKRFAWRPAPSTNLILPEKFIAAQALQIMKANLHIAEQINRQYSTMAETKMFELKPPTLKVRKPARFSA